MALEKLLIGVRIRKVRENILEESRKDFANRCNLTERYIGQIERGEFLLSLSNLDKIANATGIDTDYLLYGKCENDHLQSKENLINIIDRADKDEIKLIYKCVTNIRSYITKRT